MVAKGTAYLPSSLQTRSIASIPRTAAEIMDQNRGAGPGFDLMRLGLALTIFIFHSYFVSQGDDGSLWKGPLRPLLISLVPIFFAVSGFLVTGSALRTASLRVFVAFRVLRIAPALATEVCLSALILGPLVTRLRLRDYFGDTAFFQYFGNMVGRVRFVLPGVFIDNPMPDFVNVNLWTLRPEFYCYAIMAMLMVVGAAAKPRILTWSIMVAALALTVANSFHNLSEKPDGYQLNVPVYYFFVGVLAYHWRAKIIIDLRLFGLCAIVSYLLLRSPGYAYLAAFPVTYCMVYLGMLPLPRISLLQMGDYSYGVYLYGFPIQQTLVHFFPVLREYWPLLFCVAAPLTLSFAMLSWHFIEYPTLRLKTRVAPKISVVTPGMDAEPDASANPGGALSFTTTN
jgi:peptidoglycan/LPS O-acetylase OafA/YrhL